MTEDFKIIKVHVSFAESEFGPKHSPVYFTDVSDAVRHSSDRGPWGAATNPSTEDALQFRDGTIRVLGVPSVVHTSIKDLRRNEALAKLTPAEIELLGLNSSKG